MDKSEQKLSSSIAAMIILVYHFAFKLKKAGSFIIEVLLMNTPPEDARAESS